MAPQETLGVIPADDSDPKPYFNLAATLPPTPFNPMASSQPSLSNAHTQASVLGPILIYLSLPGSNPFHLDFHLLLIYLGQQLQTQPPVCFNRSIILTSPIVLRLDILSSATSGKNLTTCICKNEQLRVYGLNSQGSQKCEWQKEKYPSSSMIYFLPSSLTLPFLPHSSLPSLLLPIFTNFISVFISFFQGIFIF